MLHFPSRRVLAIFLLLQLVVPSAVCAAEGPLDDIPLSQALDRLSAQANIPIVYSSDTVHAGMRVEPALADADVEDTLRGWLSRWNLEYERIHDVIVVRRTVRSVQGAVAGRVRHAVTGAPQAGIEVRLAGTDVIAISAQDGSFLLQPVQAGRQEVVIVSRGWQGTQRAVVTIDESGIGFLPLEVIESVYALDAVVVAPSFYQLDETQTGSLALLTGRDIRAAPKLGGEVLRSVGYLPGVMQDGASARAHLRGGAADETLYLFDGIRLHDPFHLRDFLAPFSFLDPQRIATAAVHVGSFPVSFGNRLSGVIAFDPVEAFGQFGGEAEMNVFSTGFLLSDTFDNGATAWIASARRGHLDVLASTLETDTGTPSYFDAYLRMEHDTDGGVRLSASFLGAHDRLIINTPDGFQATRADYDDQYYWLRAAWSPAGELDVTTTLSATKLSSLRNGLVDSPEEFSGSVSDWRDIDLYGLSADIAWRITPQFRLKAGVGVEQRSAGFDYRATRRVNGPLGEFGSNGDFDRAFDGSFTGDAQHAYSELRSAVSEAVHIDAGIRVDRQGYPRGWHTDVGPRFGLAWKTGARSTLRLSAGRYWQAMCVEEIQVQDGVTQFLEPQRADTAVAGWDLRIQPRLLFRVEAFVKNVHRPWSRYENLLDSRSLVPELESDRTLVKADSARVRGVEATLSSEEPDEDGEYWITVSAMRATDRIGDRDIARSWDQQWRVDAGTSWLWGSWRMEAVVRAGAGLPYTPLALQSAGDPPRIVLGDLNSERLPTTHALDLRVSREWQRGDNTWTFYAEVINAYNGPNECCVDYSLRETGGSYALHRSLEQWYGAVPNVGFRWRF